MCSVIKGEAFQPFIPWSRVTSSVYNAQGFLFIYLSLLFAFFFLIFLCMAQLEDMNMNYIWIRGGNLPPVAAFSGYLFSKLAAFVWLQIKFLEIHNLSLTCIATISHTIIPSLQNNTFDYQ